MGSGAVEETAGISSSAGAKEGVGWNGDGEGEGAGGKAGGASGVAKKFATGCFSGAGANRAAGCCAGGAWPSSCALLKPVSSVAFGASAPVADEANGSKGLGVPARGELGELRLAGGLPKVV